MAEEIRCINAGFEDCEFLIRSENEAEVIEFAGQPAKNIHDTEASQEHLEKVMVDH